jgi:hypothetical protein|tara:strand:+ start:683 stop:922 length:240 start_codon:yes stop_codon:yes gene_type:complete
MKTRDYLHSELLGIPSNDKVFQKTYNLIGELAKELSESQAKGFDITEPKRIAELCHMNSKNISDKVIDLVNFTIKNFKK